MGCHADQNRTSLWLPLRKPKTATNLAELLVPKEGLQAIAMEQARRAESFLTEQSSSDEQIRVLKALTGALRKMNSKENLNSLEAKLAKLDSLLDKEYLAKMPPFKSEPFAGRKSKSNRAVVMELFTGAQCPPCVAADLGFDGLVTSYMPADVILLQYHLHIPGPDPLVNPDTNARADYYQTHSTPTVVMNGTVKDYKEVGGGPPARSEYLYQRYRQLIEPLLEDAPKAKIKLSAIRTGNKIDIQAQVSDLAEPGEDIKLRFVLVEETVHFVGSNKIRFHHHIVRALPGGVQGVALKEKSSQHAASVDLDELRRKLNKYLDNYAKERPFSNPDRPLELKNLHVVALVQDDDSGEILQAAQVPVGGDERVRR